MNPALKAPQSELHAAARAIDAMKTATSFDAFEAEWRQFLSCIEKAWKKTERVCQDKKDQFEPWQGKYQALRRKDMLLRYLKQARDADNHSIQDLAEMDGGKMELKFAHPHGSRIAHAEIRDGKLLSYTGDDAVLTLSPPRPVALRFKNSGQWYNPPTSHLGEVIHDADPVDLATRGLIFYTQFLYAVDVEFFSAH